LGGYSEQKISTAVKLTDGQHLIVTGFIIIRDGRDPVVRIDYALHKRLEPPDRVTVIGALYRAWKASFS